MEKDDRRAIPRPPVDVCDTEVGLDVEFGGPPSWRFTPERVLQLSAPSSDPCRAPATNVRSIGTGRLVWGHATLNSFVIKHE